MKRIKVLNVSRGTRIKAGLTLNDITTLFFIGVALFIFPSAWVSSSFLRLIFALSGMYVTYKISTYINEAYGANFVPDYINFVFTPNEYHPTEDPSPVSLMKPKKKVSEQ